MTRRQPTTTSCICVSIRHPTRETFDLAATGAGSSQRLTVPSAPSGIWYILVYSDFIDSAPAPFTLRADSGNITITESLPARAGNARPVSMTITGAGFLPGTMVELIASDGTTIFAPESTTVDFYSQVSAVFAEGLPADVYDVRVINGPRSDSIADGLTVVAGGRANLETQLILPNALGRANVATLHVEYANTGDVAMAAPLLVLQSTDEDDSDRPLLTLDETRITENFWAAGLAPGVGNSVLILGSGQQPGVLNPGERVQVPVYFLGLQRPWDFSDSQIEMEIRYWTENDPLLYECLIIAAAEGGGQTCETPDGVAEPIDWLARQEELRPPTLSNDQWAAIYGNLTDDLPTTNEYVSNAE